MTQFLSESQWKPIGKKLAELKLSDNGLQKALGTFLKLADDKVAEKERCLVILMKLATELHRRKEVNADKQLNEDIAGLISSVASEQEAMFNEKKTKSDLLKNVPRNARLQSSAWAPSAKKVADLKLSDGGLDKAVAAYEKVPLDKLPERERCLAILMKLATSLHKKAEVNADKDLNEAVARLIQGIATDQENIFNAKRKAGVK